MLRLLVSGGGTAGGVYPALAVINAIGESVEVRWVGGVGGMERDLVSRSGIEFTEIPAAGVHGVGLRAFPGNLLALVRGAFVARRIAREFKPDVAMVTGGYLSVPVALASRSVPLLAYVPDIEPALAMKLVSRLADVVAVTKEESRRYYPANLDVRVTGYPIRPALNPLDEARARSEMKLRRDLPAVLVFGGSRGARSINQAVWTSLPLWLEETQVIHLTGALDWPQLEDRISGLPERLRPRYRTFPYLHEEMAAALSAADLVVSRAGASVLGEIPHFGVPAVLVPYPHAWRYQYVNAEYLESRGAAVILQDQDLSEGLWPTVQALLGDESRRGLMAKSAQRLAEPEAARKAARILLELVQSGDQGQEVDHG